MVDIGILTDFLDSLGSYSQDLIQTLRPGQKLCHYTTLEGAQSIIAGGDLWLTNSRYSNDDEELDYGHRLVDDVLGEMEQEAKPNAPRIDWLQKLGADMRSARGDNVYICCFCETDNLLSQWRGYADNGGGVSIEFDPFGFTLVAGPDCMYGLMRLWKVFYDANQQRQIIRSCIDHPWPVPIGESPDRSVVDALQFFVSTFKGSDFREEKERRLIFTPHPGAPLTPRFRTRRGLLVPYHSLRSLTPPGGYGQDFKLPIKKLTIGPGPYRALNVESAKMLLASHDYGHVEVGASTTPFRP
jgi:hypothetical protein